VSELSTAKRALLELRMKEKEAAAEGSIPRRRDGQKARLSFAQQRLWFLQQLEAESPAYNVYGAVKLQGELNKEALRRSLQEIVNRHEALRTRFVEVEGEAMQVVGESGELEMPVVELYGEEEREGEILRLAMEEARKPFDLGRGPLLRGKLLRLGEGEHVLLLTMHHIVSDGWSVGVLVRELGVLYEAYAKGEESPLRELGIQYGDYAEWQREYLQGEVLEEQLSYWRKQLGGELPVVELPNDHVRPAVRSNRGAQQRMRVSREVGEKLKQMSREEGATLFMTLLAGFAVMLARYSGQEEVVVGTPIANRTRVETEELIGCFVNTLVMRVDARGNPKFRELVQRVKQVALEGYAHQDVPFEKVVEELQPKRDLSRTAMFQVLFVLQNAPMTETKLGGLRLEEVEFDRKVAKFDLTVTMGETEEGLWGVVEYNTDLFEAGTIARLVGHWERLLRGIAEGGGEQRVWEMALLGEGERRQLVEEWNETEASYPREKTVVELIEEQVERTPERVAVVYEGERLSYRELNGRANQLARRLQGWGVGPEEMVGICMKRSLEMVVGLLGVLKAGGAYVPLEPDYPRERLEYMVRDTGVRVVLTEERYRGLVEQEGLQVLSLDREWSEVEGEESGAVRSGVGPENLAYVIYTSGSTGKPKGVMNTHEGLFNRLWWMQQEYGLGEEDRVLQKTPYSFDVSVWEFLWPLMSGARLVMARPEGNRDSRYLVEVIEQEQITTVHFVPSMLQVFVEERDVQRCGSLRRVICSGEALSGELQERFYGRLGAELHNLYGPTEAAIDVTYWACERGGRRSSVPIGRPISNLQIYILDRYMNPVPVGVNGELHIGGVGLARGYLNRGELTAEKFVENPFAKESGARLYKTGDVARFRADGVIEYVGRMDQQVKVRGFRIELGEIEAELMQHPEVSECVVLAREDEPGTKRLVAYVVGEKQATPKVTELRNWMKERLPEYMVPAAFVTVPAIPVTANGKVDRRALPMPEASRPELEQEYVAPRTPAEETLARIWADVLQLERVGVHDNFFELGGHSLLATQVTARIRDLLHLEVPLLKIFEFPVLAEFAEVLSQPRPLPAKTAALVIRRRNAVSREDVLGKLDQLSEREIGELLSSTLTVRERK